MVARSADEARAAATAPGAAAKAAAAAKAKTTTVKKKTTTKPPVTNAGVFPLTGQSWNEIGFNEGVAPLTGKSWQQIADEEAATSTTKTVTPTKFPKIGTVLRYKLGSKTGYRVAVYADGAGGEFDGAEEINPVNPGSTGFTDDGTITLAANTFANTLALLVGETEASQPWVNELREIAQGFVNTGSTIEESINLALREAKKLGKATKFYQRFEAIFDLQDRLNAGETVQVPTIAEYVKAEQELGAVFTRVGLGELANQTTMKAIFGKANKSVAEATDIINSVFSAIDNAPDVLKNDLKTYFPGADRTSIAKALLLGKEGALELTKKVKSIEQLSAAKSQGVGISLAEGADLAAAGAEYGTSLGKFAEVKRLERGQSLGRMSNIDFTQQEAIASQFAGNAAADEKIRKISEEEMNRFRGTSGRLASQSRAQGLI